LPKKSGIKKVISLSHGRKKSSPKKTLFRNFQFCCCQKLYKTKELTEFLPASKLKPEKSSSKIKFFPLFVGNI